MQDVNVLRPLIYLAKRELDAPIVLLVSHLLYKRDKQGIWKKELKEICAETGSTEHIYTDEFTAYRILEGKEGMIIAGSESDLSAHYPTHNVFRIAPSGYIKVTLQHGLECVGFSQNKDHKRVYGYNVKFGADIVCGWGDISAMHSLFPSERSKYYQTGSTLLLKDYEQLNQQPDQQISGGIVCENLHSVRMGANGELTAPFMDNFFAFAKHLKQKNKKLTLRPHPGGQYIIKKKVVLPSYVRLNNLPMYKVNLAAYDFGISAPSSVLVDMVLAGIPTAVWQDEGETMDASSYEGITVIRGFNDWLAFERDVIERPEMLIAKQERFLQRSRMLLDAKEVKKRFTQLFNSGIGYQLSTKSGGQKDKVKQRVLFIANGLIPTLQISFLNPLVTDASGDTTECETIFGEDLKKKYADEFGEYLGQAKIDAEKWLEDKLHQFAPTLIVFSRYSDPLYDYIVGFANIKGIPIIYHIDDDLLNVPIEIGKSKYRSHNRPNRLKAVRYLLDRSDLVYCSTNMLLQRFREQGIRTPMIAGNIYCTGKVLCEPVKRPLQKIGYMGFDHAHDLNTIVPVLVNILRRYPKITFELFGSIPKPVELDEFENRVSVIPPVRGYAEFMKKFASLDWDLGLCPLANLPFNIVKANTKWVEYTSVGLAVIATKGVAYDDCCADNCGILVNTPKEWEQAVEKLIQDDEYRYQMIKNAQNRLRTEYSVSQLRKQIHRIFDSAKELRDSSYDGAARVAK